MKRRITFSLIVLVLLIVCALGFIFITNDKSNSTNELLELIRRLMKENEAECNSEIA